MDGRKINFPFFYLYFSQCRLPSIASLIVSSDFARYPNLSARLLSYIDLCRAELNILASDKVTSIVRQLRAQESKAIIRELENRDVSRIENRSARDGRSASTWLRCNDSIAAITLSLFSHLSPR